jgi:hypothetical protein
MSEVLALEKQLQTAKQLAARRDMALKLSDNREFKQLILKDFCVEECARYAQSSADPALTTEQRADALALAQAAGHLRRFLSVVVQMGNTANNEIPQIEVAIEELRQEGAE